MVPNGPKRNVFVKLLFLGNTSFQNRKKLQKLFSDNLRHPLDSKTFSSSRVSYVRSDFQDLFTSIIVVTAMLTIMEDQAPF